MSLDLPFEEGPPGQTMSFDGATIASGLVLVAITVPVPGAGVMPGLAFRFANQDGSGFYTPVLLVVDDEQMAGMAKLAADASEASIRAARQMRGA